jgi:hypothetical protein
MHGEPHPNDALLISRYDDSKPEELDELSHIDDSPQNDNLYKFD